MLALKKFDMIDIVKFMYGNFFKAGGDVEVIVQLGGMRKPDSRDLCS
jgi:hypothetical protein